MVTAVTAAPTLNELLDALEHTIRDGRPGDQLLRAGGTWNLSEVLQHCAQSIRYSVTGYPALKSGLFRTTVGPVAKRLFLRRGSMRHDVDAPLAGAPALAPERPVDNALADLRASVETFNGHDGGTHPHPAYGRCSYREYATLHAMHIGDHLPGLRSPGPGTSTSAGQKRAGDQTA
jgi:hypothetical protein